MNFQVGDRVLCIKSYMKGALVGETGKILSIECDYASVRWDDYMERRHTCSGLCEDGHGWNLPLDNLAFGGLGVDFGELPVLDITTLL